MQFARFQWRKPELLIVENLTEPNSAELRIAELNQELETLRFKWQACNEVLQQRKDLSANCRRAGKEAFERMRLRAEAIKAEIAVLQQKGTAHDHPPRSFQPQAP